MGTAGVERAATKPMGALPVAPTEMATLRQRQRKLLGRVDGLGRLRMVVGNTAISLAGQCVTWASTLFLTMAYGRFLGPNGFGELYLAVTLVGLIGFPLEFGFNQQIIREAAQTPARANRFLSSVLILKCSLWAPLWGMLLLATWILHYSPEERTLVTLSGVTLLATSIGAAFGSMHIAVHRNVTPVVGSILEKSLDAVVAYALLRVWHADVIAVACVLLAGAAVNALWQATWFFKLERPVLSLDMLLIREIVRTSIPFLAYGVLGVIYYRVDTVMLGVMDGDTVVGWYGAGYRIFDTLIFLPSLVMSTVMYPLMARLSKHEPEALQLAVEKSTNFLVIIGMPLAAGLAAAAPAIVGFLYHHTQFSPTTAVIEALAPGLILLYLNSVISSLIISVKRERVLTWMAGVALVLNVSLNFLLIPRYHAVAAAGVTSITEGALLVMGLFVIPRDVIPVRSAPTLVKAVLASAAMAVVILAMAQFSILVILPAAAITYALAGVCLRLIPRSDLEALMSALRRKARHKAQSEPTASDTEERQDDATTTELMSPLGDVTPPLGASLVAHKRLAERAAQRMTPACVAWLDWLQAPTSSATRARLVARARSTSGPLTAAQRLAPPAVGQPQRVRVVTAPRSAAPRRAQQGATSAQARRRKAGKQRRGARKQAAA